MAKRKTENLTEQSFLSKLSSPARSALIHEGIDTLQKLAAYTEKEILRLHGIGPASLPVLRASLSEEGMSFKENGGKHMDAFQEYLTGIDDLQQRERTEEVLAWVQKTFPQLEPVMKWNQPMFTDHGTYIIGFSTSKKHLAVAPEQVAMKQFFEEIEKTGYGHTKELVRIDWKSPVDFSLLERIIEFNIADKADCTTFWRE